VVFEKYHFPVFFNTTPRPSKITALSSCVFARLTKNQVPFFLSITVCPSSVVALMFCEDAISVRTRARKRMGTQIVFIEFLIVDVRRFCGLTDRRSPRSRSSRSDPFRRCLWQKQRDDTSCGDVQHSFVVRPAEVDRYAHRTGGSSCVEFVGRRFQPVPTFHHRDQDERVVRQQRRQ